MQTKEHDLAISASNSFLLIYDNLSGMSKRISDLLCLIATGGVYETRKLRSDDQEHVLPLLNPVILTGICNTGEREDLLDRSLVATLQPIPETGRRTVTDIEAEFNAVRPQILGALYTIIAAGLAKLPTTRLERMPRMADSALFGAACEEALGWEPGTACSLLFEAKEESMRDVLSEDPFGQALYQEVRTLGSLEMTANGLTEHMLQHYPEQARRSGWPRDPRGLAERVNELTPVLKQFNVEVTKRRGNGNKFICLQMVPAAECIAAQQDVASLN